MYIRKILLFLFFFLNLCFGQGKNVGLGQSGGGGITGITSDGTTITITLPVVITPISGTGLVLTRATNDTLKLLDSGGNLITIEDNNVVKFMVDADGDVGIGTATPEALLEVQGVEATDAELILDADDGDDATDTWTLRSAAIDNELNFFNGVSERFRFGKNGDFTTLGGTAIFDKNGVQIRVDPSGKEIHANGFGGLLFDLLNDNGGVALDATSDIELQIANVTKAIIKSSGNVGIGTTAPDSVLDVNGGSKFRDNINITQAGGTGTTDPTQVIINNSTSNGSAEIRISEDSGAGEDGVIVRYFSSADATDNELRFIKFTNGTEQNVFPLVIDRDGEVRVGTTTAPSAGGGLGTMIFADTGTAPTPGTNTAAIFGDDVAGTVHMFATQEGNGTGTQLSSHNTKGDPVHFSYNKAKDEAVYINLIKLAKAIEKISGEKLVYTSKIVDKDNPTATRLYLEKLAGDLDED